MYDAEAAALWGISGLPIVMVAPPMAWVMGSGQVGGGLVRGEYGDFWRRKDKEGKINNIAFNKY